VAPRSFITSAEFVPQSTAVERGAGADDLGTHLRTDHTANLDTSHRLRSPDPEAVLQKWVSSCGHIIRTPWWTFRAFAVGEHCVRGPGDRHSGHRLIGRATAFSIASPESLGAQRAPPPRPTAGSRGRRDGSPGTSTDAGRPRRAASRRGGPARSRRRARVRRRGSDRRPVRPSESLSSACTSTRSSAHHATDTSAPPPDPACSTHSPKPRRPR
jgi:hypothetical protein